MNMVSTDWPQDADGDVLRRMHSAGFDFSKPCLIDFNVDFENWPPSEDAIQTLELQYPSAKVYSPVSGESGHIQFQLFELLSYRLVVETQEHVSTLMAPYGGSCESWGILH